MKPLQAATCVFVCARFNQRVKSRATFFPGSGIRYQVDEISVFGIGKRQDKLAAMMNL